MELLQQALVGLQEDRRSMQVTCDVSVIFLCDVWRLTCVCRVLFAERDSGHATEALSSLSRFS